MDHKPICMKDEVKPGWFCACDECDSKPMKRTKIIEESECTECGGYGIIGRDCKCNTIPTVITIIDNDIK